MPRARVDQRSSEDQSGKTRLTSSRIRSSTSSMDSAVESTRTASAAARNGATARLRSRASRSRMSSTRSARLASNPFSFNCLYRRSRALLGAGVEEDLQRAPRERPRCPCRARPPPARAAGPGAAASPAGRRAPAGMAATREAAMPAASVRIGVADVLAVQQHPVAGEGHAAGPRPARPGPRASSRSIPRALGGQPQHPVQGAAVQAVPAQPLGDQARRSSPCRSRRGRRW